MRVLIVQRTLQNFATCNDMQKYALKKEQLSATLTTRQTAKILTWFVE